MSTLSAIAAPMEPRGFMARTGALVAGTAFAGAAIFGGVAVAPTVTAGLSASVQRDFVLTADPTAFPTFTDSLQNLLVTLGYGNMGDVLEQLFGKDSAGVPNVTTASDLSVLLAALNPKGLTLDGVTGNLFSSDISDLLAKVMLPVTGEDGTTTTLALGVIPIDQLIGGFIGGTGTDESIGNVLSAISPALAPYLGLLDLSFLGIDLSPNTTVGDLLDTFLGIDGTTTLDSLVIGNGETLGDATVGGLLGIDGSTPWDQFLDGIKLGGTIIDPGGTSTLGDESLGALLTSLLGVGATDVTDTTTVTDFLSDLGIFQMLGITS